MCGICGIIGIADSERINSMLQVMKHRGPDDQGIFVGNRTSIGMVRLSIIDLSPLGHQPMSNENQTIWIVYNGELYNFLEEKQILINKGYSFRSKSDTEVVLKMYEEYGDECVKRMRGMFAFAIYDKRKPNERYLLARDHFGIKPLLYTEIDNKFIFASEVKSILASQLVPKKINFKAFEQLFSLGSVTQPNTIIENVQMLMPAHRMIIEKGHKKIEKYWHLGIDRIPGLRNQNYEEQVEILKNTLLDSVKSEMISDVPIGSFLSGGVDSSLTTALMAKQSGIKVKTFSVGYLREGSDLDESDEAQKIAHYIGTDHQKVLVTGKDFKDKLSHIVDALDQPSVDGVNSYFVSWAASQFVTVAISGTGGDEFFAGYPWFANSIKQNQNKFYTFLNNQSGLLSQISKLYEPRIYGHISRFYELFLAPKSFLNNFTNQYYIFGKYGSKQLISPDFYDPLGSEKYLFENYEYADELKDATSIERVSALTIRTYLQNQLLRDIDAVSMSHSLEIRVPFIDWKVADTALSLPDITKINIEKIKYPGQSYQQTGTKRILLDIAKKLLPPDLGRQSKKGFTMPFGYWMKTELKDVLEDTLSSKTIKNRGFFRDKTVQKLKTRFYNGNLPWTYIWLMVLTELWCRKNIDN